MLQLKAPPEDNLQRPKMQSVVEDGPSVDDQMRRENSNATPLIPSDAYRPGKSDFLNLPAAKAALKKTTFGYLFPDHTVEVMFEAGRAGELFPNCAMDENHPNVFTCTSLNRPTRIMCAMPRASLRSLLFGC